jgi:hypothetical protein
MIGNPTDQEINPGFPMQPSADLHFERTCLENGGKGEREKSRSVERKKSLSTYSFP